MISSIAEQVLMTSDPRCQTLRIIHLHLLMLRIIHLHLVLLVEIHLRTIRLHLLVLRIIHLHLALLVAIHLRTIRFHLLVLQTMPHLMLGLRRVHRRLSMRSVRQTSQLAPRSESTCHCSTSGGQRWHHRSRSLHSYGMTASYAAILTRFRGTLREVLLHTNESELPLRRTH